MATIVVPHRGPSGKTRLPALPSRPELVAAMLEDVLAACLEVDRTVVVTPEPVGVIAGVEVVMDQGSGQGLAVAAGLALAQSGSVLVLNSDLPCATPTDLELLLGAVPPGGLALVPAADGTTNALALSSANLFRPLYGPGSAARFAALARSRALHLRNLVDDVDTVHDLARIADRAGPRTRAVWQAAA
jgi:2-phospho-L-lactate/phosphoenolpyruvate guanylyltransferase